MTFSLLISVFFCVLFVVAANNSTYAKPKFGGPSCGTCGTSYQACCIGFGADGYPCDCHLQEGGSGKSGAECGDCGTAFAACCIGYAADGYPCECDVA